METNNQKVVNIRYNISGTYEKGLSNKVVLSCFEGRGKMLPKEEIGYYQRRRDEHLANGVIVTVCIICALVLVIAKLLSQ